MKLFDYFIVGLVFIGWGWAGNNDYEYRQAQAAKHLAVLHAAK
jgi:hypothetical protein